MIALTNFFPKQLSQSLTLAYNLSIKRTIYAPSFFGIDQFKKHSQLVQKLQSGSIETTRKTIQEAVDNNATKIFTDDLKSLLYTTNTDADFELVLKATKKYYTQDELKLFTFNFDTPLMRLAYVLNKTDAVLALFLQEERNFFHSSMNTANILMNKLYEENRYDDVFAVFKKLFQIKDGYQKRDDKSTIVPTIAINIVLQALKQKNNAKAVEELIEVLKICKSENISLSVAALVDSFLLATQQNNFPLAFEIVANSDKKDGFILPNLKIITLCNMNRNSEALVLAKELVSRNLRFFKTTVSSLKETAKNNLEDQKILDEILTQIQSLNLERNEDLKDFSNKVLEFKKTEDMKRNTGGNETFNKNNSYNKGYSNERNVFDKRQPRDNTDFKPREFKPREFKPREFKLRDNESSGTNDNNRYKTNRKS